MRLHAVKRREHYVIDEATDRLSRGGEGSVYALPQSSLVAKVYSRPSGRRAKIEAMLRDPPSDRSVPGHVSIAWPIDLLQDDNGRFVGFLMPRVPRANTLNDITNPKLRKKAGLSCTLPHLLGIGSNIAAAFGDLHRKGYVVGDVNEANVLVTSRGLVSLVDTDSFQITDRSTGRIHRCTVGQEPFTAPELLRLVLSQGGYANVERNIGHDLYGLGVLLFRLLMEGHDPHSGVDQHKRTLEVRDHIMHCNFPWGSRQGPLRPPPHAPAFDRLPPTIQQLFIACFEHGQRDPSARPDAATWKRELFDASGYRSPQQPRARPPMVISPGISATIRRVATKSWARWKALPQRTRQRVGAAALGSTALLLAASPLMSSAPSPGDSLRPGTSTNDRGPTGDSEHLSGRCGSHPFIGLWDFRTTVEDAWKPQMIGVQGIYALEAEHRDDCEVEISVTKLGHRSRGRRDTWWKSQPYGSTTASLEEASVAFAVTLEGRAETSTYHFEVRAEGDALTGRWRRPDGGWLEGELEGQRQ